jgi:hypothetical protein
MHRKVYMNLLLFSFSEFCRLAEQEFRRFDNMKDVVLDEGISTNLTSYFSEMLFIFMDFQNSRTDKYQI